MTSQCPHCGAVNQPDAKCFSCGTMLISKEAQEDRPSQNGLEMYRSLVVDDLVAPPRTVPIMLAMICADPILLGGILGSTGVVMLLFAPIMDDHAVAGLGVVCALAMLWVLRRGHRRYQLLRTGIAARAEFVSSSSSGSLEASHLRSSKGWDIDVCSYRGTSYRSKLRLWGPDGSSHTFSSGGIFGDMEYQGEIYIFDPDHPRRHLGAISLGVPLRPDGKGEWRVWPRTKRVMVFRLVVGIALAIPLLFSVL